VPGDTCPRFVRHLSQLPLPPSTSSSTTTRRHQEVKNPFVPISCNVRKVCLRSTYRAASAAAYEGRVSPMGSFVHLCRAVSTGCSQMFHAPPARVSPLDSTFLLHLFHLIRSLYAGYTLDHRFTVIFNCISPRYP
jgi:hypothetical protein